MTPRLSVLIPAHNEAAVIGRCLDTLLADAAPGEFQVCVVANGCTDDTAARARRPGVTVLDLPAPGKTAALQAGDDALSAWPRIYLDADIELSTAASRALAEELAGPTSIASVLPDVVLDGCSAPVRAFYRTWQQLPWLSNDPVGNGVFALSEAARSSFGAWPTIIADDLYAVQLFPDTQRRCLTGHSFTLRPPRTLRSLLKVRRRVVLGNDELAGLRAAGTLPPARSGPTYPVRDAQVGDATSLRTLLTRRGDRLSALVYVGVVVWARVLARLARGQGQAAWDRDLSSR